MKVQTHTNKPRFFRVNKKNSLNSLQSEFENKRARLSHMFHHAVYMNCITSSLKCKINLARNTNVLRVCEKKILCWKFSYDVQGFFPLKMAFIHAFEAQPELYNFDNLKDFTNKFVRKTLS